MVKFNFLKTTLCDLNNVDATLGNTFLDASKVNILHNKNKVKFCAKIGLN